MMLSIRPNAALLSSLVLGACAAGTSTPAGAPPASPEAASEPSMALYSTLGPYARTITTGSEQAQAYFTQGVQLMYAFTPADAAVSFKVAQRHDPDCAMCFWGEAWAWGPYLNGPMTADNAPKAYAAIQEARKRMGSASAVERALIEAMTVRYEPELDRERRRALDQAYSDAMADVAERFPQDLEVVTLYGESLMLLQPRRGTWDIESDEVQKIHRVLEGALTQKIDHPGACHLYVHATESTVRPGKAEACADHLGDAIPGASHINHMPSHTYNRIGRWDDAVRANIQAWHSDIRAEYGEGFAIYPQHNLHMLLFAASMAGQGAAAVQAAKDYAKLPSGGTFYRPLALVRFGRFDEVLEIEDDTDHAIFGGFWDWGRGYAHLRMGDAAQAERYLQRVKDAAIRGGDSVVFRGHTAADLLGVVGGILEGEIAYDRGDVDEAVRVLERAIEIEDGLRYDEPEPLNFSARHWLGAILLESNRPIEAEAVYRAALEDHPNNGWCLFGLEQALVAQGKTADARRTRQQFEEAWARADVWIRSSRF
jgi:tetratricopeptide (TPR) repeat protein